MSELTVGLLHPGEMGHTVGASAREGGTRVIWASERRSQATAERAAAAGLEAVETLAALADGSQVILSVCPPDAAAELARAVIRCGFRGTYVDANAVAPQTARGIATEIEKAGAVFVDGGIIGPPARSPGSTRLYLSGAAADEVATLFTAGPLQAIPIGAAPGAASALKMSYAAYTKGSAALLMAIRAMATREGVDGALLEEWSISQPPLPAVSAGALRGTARKAWRFVGEMQEIASSLDAAGLPGDFHRAAAAVYARLSGYRDVEEAPSPEEVIAALLGR
jgi:3-hydroxyisobutyrate dehydrogenase-like beta-hydroxyacid dehydrogenase